MADDGERVADQFQEPEFPQKTTTNYLALQRLRHILETTVFPGGLIGSSHAIEAIHQLLQKIIESECRVLILGETGTGKELVARCVHLSGARKHRPFVAVDCSAISNTLFESELFGYVKGAFTGAVRDHKGLFQAAETGTLFLDEIGELPKELQAKLLRAIQEGEIRRVGSTELLPVDVYYRLNVVQISVPTLRHRKVDIPLLVAAFLKKYEDPYRTITEIGADFWSGVMEYNWPGNVRELEHLVQRCIVLGSGPVLHDEDRPRILWQTGEIIERRAAEPLAALERRAILKAIAETDGDKPAAARILGIGKTTLYRKLKEYRFNSSQIPIASGIS